MQEESVQDVAIPGFEILRRLGRGQVADVYLAREPELSRLVALKVAHPEVVADPTARRRFEREGQAAARLVHPGVVQVHRVGQTAEGRPVLVMQYVKGRSLEERLAAAGRLDVEEARRILSEVAEALEVAHRHGIVHRDVRPGNILEDEETHRFLLTDFGLAALLETGDAQVAKLTATGQLVGDVRFMSPEQLRGERVTEQADVYQLGVLAHYLLTGEGPFGEAASSRLLVAHLQDKPRDLSLARPEVEAGLAELIHRCLSKEPSRRPTTSDVARSLRNAEDLPQLAAPLELLRRRVPHFVLGSTIAGWLLITVVDVFIQNGVLPPVAFFLALDVAGHGIVAAMVLSWFHGARGRQEVQPLEVALLTVVVASLLAFAVRILLA